MHEELVKRRWLGSKNTKMRSRLVIDKLKAEGVSWRMLKWIDETRVVGSLKDFKSKVAEFGGAAAGEKWPILREIERAQWECERDLEMLQKLAQGGQQDIDKVNAAITAEIGGEVEADLDTIKQIASKQHYQMSSEFCSFPCLAWMLVRGKQRWFHESYESSNPETAVTIFETF